jgi:hypothetical protein
MATTGKKAQADEVAVEASEAPVEETEVKEEPKEAPKAKAEKPEEKVDPQVVAKLKELEANTKWLSQIDSKRTQRKELIETLQLMGCKNATIRKATGLSNAGYLNAQK